jgi:hypothetical protein
VHAVGCWETSHIVLIREFKSHRKVQ